MPEVNRNKNIEGLKLILSDLERFKVTEAQFNYAIDTYTSLCKCAIDVDPTLTPERFDSTVYENQKLIPAEMLDHEWPDLGLNCLHAANIATGIAVLMSLALRAKGIDPALCGNSKVDWVQL